MRVPLTTVARELTRIGLTGFGGPPAHIALLRELAVERRGWMTGGEFADANAACGLLPGPASTQMAMFCAYRAAGRAGLLVGGLGFVVPAVVVIIALSALFLATSPPRWIAGAGAGAGAAVPVVALAAAWALAQPSFAGGRARVRPAPRWIAYVAVAAATAILAGPLVVVALLGCGILELAASRQLPAGGVPMIAVPAVIGGGALGPLVWTALKVGALSFGGGFVIIPLIQGDAVHAHHWMSAGQFLTAVALGQVTPGPVVATVAAVGFAADGVLGGIVAAVVAFMPSFLFILVGARQFERLREDRRARAFLGGAGPAAIGAILGAAIVLAQSLHHGWQFAVLGAAAVALFALRRGVVAVLIGAGVAGSLLASLGVPV